MKILVQRVKSASVKIDQKLYSSINHGYLVFLGISKNDNDEKIDWFINKLLNLRIFENDDGKMSLSIQDVGGEILLVSQFTLCGNCLKGNRPSFDEAMIPNEAEKIYNKFVAKLSEKIQTQTGIFGAMMDIQLINDGPVTFMIEK